MYIMYVHVCVCVCVCVRVYVYIACCFSSVILPFQGVMLVYDITNHKSFDEIPYWMKLIKKVR